LCCEDAVLRLGGTSQGICVICNVFSSSSLVQDKSKSTNLDTSADIIKA
jgi:hypothetical protein